MIVASTELKTNLGKYLDLVSSVDVVITRNGRKVAKLVKEEDEFSEIQSLFGILAESEVSYTEDEQRKAIIQEERGKRYDGAD